MIRIKSICTKIFTPAIFLAVPLASLVFGPSAFASAQDDQANRAKLSGTWQNDSSQGTGWTLTENGDSLHIVNTANGQTVADFTCNTEGKECTVKQSGHPAKVSMWFNGPRLVELETTGNQTIRRRFVINTSGDTLDVETTMMSSSAPPETTHYKRATTQSASK